MSPTMATHFIGLAIGLAVFWRCRVYYAKRRYGSSERYQTFWPRFFSMWCDGLVLWPLTGLHLLLAGAEAPGFVQAIAVVLTSVATWTYIVWLHARYGATVGKMNCRVRIVDAVTEEPIGLRQAFVRELCPIAAGVIVLVQDVVLLTSGRLTLNPAAHHSRPIQQVGGFGFINSIPVLWFVAEVVTMLTNDKRRALHDWIAGTVVVRTLADGPAVGV